MKQVPMQSLRTSTMFLTLVAAFVVAGLLLKEENYILHFFVLGFIWASVAEAWNLIFGFAGIHSFAQIAFFTQGAFAGGIFAQQHGTSPWLAILGGGLVAGLAGLLIGFPSLRLRGGYIAVLSYSLHLVLGPLIYRASAIGVNPGGYIWNIPALTLFGYAFQRNEILPWYYVALAMCAMALLLIRAVLRSRAGRALVALRDAAPMAASLGINEYQYRLFVFLVSAFVTGSIGAFYCFYTGTISTRMLGLDFFVKALIMMIIGGLGRFPGGAVGAFVIVFADELMRPLMNYRSIVFGALVVIVMIFFPTGLMGVGGLLGRVWRTLVTRLTRICPVHTGASR